MRKLIVSIIVATAILGCEKSTSDLSQGLEEEKSQTRHAMEAYTQNPISFRGNKNVLETWSRSDYVALAVAEQKVRGNWAKTSDTLDFLDSKLRRNPAGIPFCVIQQESRIVVLSIRSATTLGCSSDMIKDIAIYRIKSGDMEFSGRSDYWVYVFRP